MDQDTMKAFAMARLLKDLEKDPVAKKFAQESGASLEEAAEAYMAMKMKHATPARPERPLTPKPAPTVNGKEHGAALMTRPDAFLRVLAEVGHPMERMAIYKEAIQRGWLEPIKKDAGKHVGIAFMRLKTAQKIIEFPGNKPRKVGLPGQTLRREVAEASEFFG